MGFPHAEDHNPGHVFEDTTAWLANQKSVQTRVQLGVVIDAFNEMADKVGYDEALLVLGQQAYIDTVSLGASDLVASYVASLETGLLSELANRTKI